MTSAARAELRMAAVFGAAMIALLLMPGSAGKGLASLILVWGLFALGYDIAFGVAGMLSFGHAAMFGVGGYVATLMMTRAGLGFGPGLVAAGVVGAMLALAFSLIALRASGLFFTLLTLALAQLVSIVVSTRFRDILGGVEGLTAVPRPRLGTIDFSDNDRYLLLLAVFFVLGLTLAWLIRRSPLGLSLNAIRANEVRASQLGIDPTRMRRIAFAISGAYAGVSGALLASLLFYVSPQMLSWSTSGDIVIMVVLGGNGTLMGPVLGVTIVEVLKEGLGRLTEHWYGLLGIIFIVATIFLPTGVAGLFRPRTSVVTRSGR